MKKKFLATIMIMAVVMATISGCGSEGGSSNVTAAQTVENKTPEKVEAVTPETEKVEEVKEPEKVEETKVEVATEVPKEEPAAEPAPEAAEESTPEVVEEETAKTDDPAKAAVIDKYIADGDFSDYKEYGFEMGATDVRMSKDEWNFDLYYDGYIVTVGTNIQDPQYAFVGTKHNAKGQTMEYACIISYIDVPTIPVSDKAFIPVELCYQIEETLKYMKDHPDVTQKPEIPGMTWESWAKLIGG